MNSSRRHSIRSNARAFSLVEVTLALAVIAIGLIAILGLLPHGLQASRDAADNTIAATIVQDIFSEMRSQPFTGPPYNLSAPGSTPPLYFTHGGFATNAAGRYFQVAVNWEPQPPLSLSRVTATVVWPAQAAAPINTNIFVTNVAWYDRL